MEILRISLIETAGGDVISEKRMECGIWKGILSIYDLVSGGDGKAYLLGFDG